MRLFAAITPPEDVLDHCSRALEMLNLPRLARNPWVPSANWHITLAFYGETSDGLTEELAQNMMKVSTATAPFPLELSGAGTFRHDVCWIGVSDPKDVLGGLAAQLRGEWVSAPQHATNRFHVTISRAGQRAGLGEAMRALSVYRGPEWMVESLDLYRSDLGDGVGGHPLYTRVAETRLEGPPLS